MELRPNFAKQKVEVRIQPAKTLMEQGRDNQPTTINGNSQGRCNGSTWSRNSRAWHGRCFIPNSLLVATHKTREQCPVQGFMFLIVAFQTVRGIRPT